MKFSIKLLIFFLLLVWCLGIFSEWIVSFCNSILFAIPFLHKTYSIVCHQIKEKLITADNHSTLVCARCAGIYLGLLVSSLVSLFTKWNSSTHTEYLFISAAALIADAFFSSITLYHYSKYLAFCTGLLFGSVGFLYFYDAVNQLFNEIRRNKK
jgi:uncharacterized membrane protein